MHELVALHRQVHLQGAFVKVCTFVMQGVSQNPGNFERHWTRLVRDRQGTTQKLYDKDVAAFSSELSGAVCLKTLALLGNALDLFRKRFGAVRAIFWGFVSPYVQLLSTLIVKRKSDF